MHTSVVEHRMDRVGIEAGVAGQLWPEEVCSCGVRSKGGGAGQWSQ